MNVYSHKNLEAISIMIDISSRKATRKSCYEIVMNRCLQFLSFLGGF